MEDSRGQSPESILRAKMRAEREQQREEYKKILWNNRLALLKKGQVLAQNNRYGDAAIIYEKYIKILEIIYECGNNGLTPEMLKESGRTNELSVLTGIYWDLVRIYDSNPSYVGRQKKVADKLARFALFTPLYNDIIKKARLFQKQSKQPELIKNMIAASAKDKPRCFIATAAFEDPMAFEVQALRYFRDEELKKYFIGRQFIFYYYRYSPAIAKILDSVQFLKPMTRFFIRLLVKFMT